uniref:Amino acid transporter transmembrane domain-containing protein n=1 Tax=Oryza barthii TaxID=65489 RepID=A0A0D3FWQ1_9ORYZ
MVGAGVLSLPYAMAHLGWGPGTAALVVSWGMTLYTLRLLIELHECVPGVRFDRCTTSPTGSASSAPPSSSSPSLPSLDSITAVSLAAAAMSVGYSTISWAACLARGTPAAAEGGGGGVSYAYKDGTAADSVFRVCSALGQVAFAYAGHGVVLEIQATIPSTPTKPSRGAMWKGAVAAYLVTALCYFPVAIAGYWAFGRDVSDNVLVALRRPPWLVAAANMMVVVHVLGSYQVYAMPIFETLETILITRIRLPPGALLRLVARSAYVAFTLFVAVTFPFFGDLLGFFGGFGFTPTSYFLPCILWLKIKKPPRFSASWFANWGCIVVGVLLMIASTIGGLRSIIQDASTFQFYS